MPDKAKRSPTRDNQSRTKVKKNEFNLEDDTQSVIGGVGIGICVLSIHQAIDDIPPKGEDKTGWYEFDSGAQAHTTNELHRLTNKQPSTVMVTDHDGNITTPEYKGDIYLPIMEALSNYETFYITLSTATL